ncbi:MAG: hypothetical protein AB7K36_11415 [Chloroflexota bacterium]
MKHAHHRVRVVIPLLVLAAATLGMLFGRSADYAVAAIGGVCPVPTSEVQNGIQVCTDRGDGATYTAGDLITVCVSANIPQIAIYPPPPPPQIRVEDVAADGSSTLLMEANMASGQRCVSGRIVEPLGQETIRAQALGQAGKVFQEASISITTVAR